MKLPWLSAYLGHQDILGSEVYLKATPELLELASQRFEKHSRSLTITMSRSSGSLFTHVQSYFTEYQPKQRGASVHAVRAYRDALTMQFKFVATERSRGVSALQPGDIDAEVVMLFLDILRLND